MEALQLMKELSNSYKPEHSFLHKKISLPANQIITKQYALDEKPIMKLITKQELQKSEKNIVYVPPKIKNSEFQKYGQEFHVADFLGFKYADNFDQMVYFRYNNQGYNQFKNSEQQKGVKYFSGLFIPPKTLLSKQFKNHQNIFEALSIDCPQIKNSISQSFGKNSKGCSLDPMFSSNYTGGNLMAAIRKNPFEYDLILQNDTNCKSAQWFNFAVKFIQEGTYTFNIVNLNSQFPFYDMGMKIPHYSFHQQSYKTQSPQNIKSGSGWNFGCKNIQFYKSDLRKQTQMMDQSFYNLTFQFKCKNRQQIAVFASSIPYVEIDFERFLNKVLYNRIGQHMKMEKIDICETLAGNTLRAYMFYHRKTKSSTMLFKNKDQQKIQNSRSSEKHKTFNIVSNKLNTSLMNTSSLQTTLNCPKTIVFLARQHSGQTVSSFLIEGIIQFLMDNTQFDLFKKNFHFVVIPFVNPDGVKYGNQRVNLAGRDLEKSWKKPNQCCQPEVYHIKNFLKNLNQANPISLLLDLQSNSHTLSSYFTANLQKKQTYQNPQLFPFICSKRISQISFQKSQFLPRQQKNSTLNILSETFPKALVYNFSCSSYGWKTQYGFRKYTQTDEQDGIHQFSPQILRNIGREMITTYLEYVRLCDKNIGIRDRWIKQIQAAFDGNHIRQDNFYKKKIEQTWQRQTIKADFSSFLPEIQSLTDKKKEHSRRHNTLVLRPSQNLEDIRSNSKKRTLPNMKLQMYSKLNKQNTQKSNGLGLSNSLQNSSDAILGKFKSSPLSSSIFTPKRRSQILKQISQSIKQEGQKENPSNSNASYTAQLGHKDKRLSKYFDKYKENNKTKIKDAIVKFQGMKKFMTTMGIKAEATSAVN